MNTLAEPCLEWAGARYPNGYGRMGGRGLAHRVVFIETHGAIPVGLEIDHICNNWLCIQPSHLRAMTHRENVMRAPRSVGAVNAAKTACPVGHPYSGRDNRGRRICGECKRLWRTRAA